MKAFKEIGGSALIVFSMVGSLFCIHEVATANADTVGQVAHEVCMRLYAEPTVDNMQAIVDEMLIRYTEESENEIMHMAMQDVCPEFKPLAIAAFTKSIPSLYT